MPRRKVIQDRDGRIYKENTPRQQERIAKALSPKGTPPSPRKKRKKK